jgi:hypothetical protein
VLTFQTRIERRCDRLDNTQSCVHGTLRVVLVRLRIAEVDQQPIAKIPGNMAREALDNHGTDLLIGPDYLAQVFGIELLRQSGRLGAEEIAV